MHCCLAYGLKTLKTLESNQFPSTAADLRLELENYISENCNEKISGNAISDWVLWDSKSSVTAYTDRMRHGSDWGGAIEIAVCARIKNIEVHIYERKDNNFQLISKFEPCFSNYAKIERKFVSVVYGGRCHYDALVIL